MFLLSEFSIFYVLNVFHNKQVENQTCNLFLVFFITKKIGSQTENTWNTMFVFFEIFSYYTNLVVSMFSVFFIRNKLRTKHVICSQCFS